MCSSDLIRRRTGQRLGSDVQERRHLGLQSPLCEHNQRTIFKTALKLYARRIRFTVNSANFIPPFPHHPEVTTRVWTYIRRRRRNGPPARMATGLPPGGSPAHTLAVAQPPTTTPITHPPRSTPPSASTPPAQTWPADRHRAQTPTTHHATQQTCHPPPKPPPANNAPALNETDIARAGRNPAPTLAAHFSINPALYCYLYVLLYTGIN